jgi:hypothetical protein
MSNAVDIIEKYLFNKIEKLQSENDNLLRENISLKKNFRGG